MKKTILILIFSLLVKLIYAQVEVRDSVFVKIYDLEPNKYSFGMNDGKIGLVSIYLKNKYEEQKGYLTGYFGSNLTLKQKHKLDPRKILTYEEYVNLIDKDIMKVFYYYKVYFIISEAKYDYLTLQVRQILPPEFRQQ